MADVNPLAAFGSSDSTITPVTKIGDTVEEVVEKVEEVVKDVKDEIRDKIKFLHEQHVASMNGRLEGDIGLGDEYWQLKQDIQKKIYELEKGL